ncbi:MAG: asparagine synthase (glutamine-hydrolyzing), partial [Planctomycetota bacterium]
KRPLLPARCDTEVLVHGFEAWGEELPVRLRGMFAFAAYDRSRDRLLLARDRLGIKPLYLHRQGERLVFGSEVRALLASGLVETAVDVSLIDTFVTLGYVPQADTLFAGIRKLRPGFLLVADGKGIVERKYWHAERAPRLELGYDEAKERLLDLLIETTRLHLMSDVPLGVFLSGGVDSSAVAAIMRRRLGCDVRTFSIGYGDDPASSELPQAAKVARHLDTDHHELILTHRDFFDGLDALLEHAEEPVVESAAVALMQLARFAREHAIVLLSGEGADEVFAGYDLYDTMRRLDRIRRAVPVLRAKPVRELLQVVVRTEKLRKYVDWLQADLGERYRGISSDVTDSVRRRMYTRELRAQAGASVDRLFEGLFDEARDLDPLAQMQYVDLKTWLADDLLLKADKMTMAASIELRVPFLDHEVVELGLGLPTRHKLRRGVGKRLLKEALEPMLPKDILYRPKQGFPVPIARWFRHDLHERVREVLLDPGSLRRGYFRPRYVERVLSRHRRGREDLSRRIFTLLTLELWHRRYVD